MRQVLHLLILDPHRIRALVARYGSRWLLPVVTCHERARAAPAAARWAAEQGIACEVAGQWLGRVGTDADWLLVMRGDACSPKHETLQWTPLGSLSPAAALLDYQAWAVATSLRRGPLPSVPGPFGNITWTDDVKAWIGTTLHSTPSSSVPYRITPHEVVTAHQTPCGRVYFKGLTQERVREARLTQALAAIQPPSFARTLAFEERDDGAAWWLTAECQGHTAPGGADVSAALARLQQRVISCGPVRRELNGIEIEAAVRWTSELIDNATCIDEIRQHARMVVKAHVPESWIPMDLDPTNVLVDESGTVRFIDLDESYFGPAPLAVATFATRCRDASLYRRYEQSWSPALRDVDWRSFEVVAAVFEAWRGWQRVEQNTRRGELHGALELAAARIRERLARILHRR